MANVIMFSVDSITDDDWVLELEDLEKDTAKIIQTLSISKRSIKEYGTDSTKEISYTLNYAHI